MFSDYVEVQIYYHGVYKIPLGILMSGGGRKLIVSGKSTICQGKFLEAKAQGEAFHLP